MKSVLQFELNPGMPYFCLIKKNKNIKDMKKHFTKKDI